MLLWTVATVAFVLAATYAIGGRAAFRRMLDARRRAVATIQATLQPPSPADVRGTVADTATAPRIEGAEPVSVAFITTTIVGVIGFAIIMFYVTGRRR